MKDGFGGGVEDGDGSGEGNVRTVNVKGGGDKGEWGESE